MDGMSAGVNGKGDGAWFWCPASRHIKVVSYLRTLCSIVCFVTSVVMALAYSNSFTLLLLLSISALVKNVLKAAQSLEALGLFLQVLQVSPKRLVMPRSS